jgi:hypothetical protein
MHVLPSAVRFASVKDVARWPATCVDKTEKADLFDLRPDGNFQLDKFREAAHIATDTRPPTAERS